MLKFVRFVDVFALGDRVMNEDQRMLKAVEREVLEEVRTCFGRGGDVNATYRSGDYVVGYVVD